MKKILIIDDDDFIRKMLASVIQKAGYEVYEAPDGETGLKYVELKNPDLVITDFKMPGISGLEVVTELVRTHPGLPVVMLTAYGDVSLTIKAIQSGAYDYIEKPIKNRELIEAIENGIQASIQSKSLTKIISPEARKALEDSLLAGKTPAMREIFKNIGRISLTKVNVMITGEAGTGKEQIARLIHYSGITREQPFVVVNCNSASEEILEHELFGYTKVTTNGVKEKKGKIELAEDGTLFLDEFQELTTNLQNSLLRVIQNNEFIKQGEDLPVPLKCRIITSTKSDIESLVNDGIFLKDLYFRLRVFTITLPPLRERIDDIPELLQNLLQKLNRKLNRRVHKVEDGVTGILKNYDWPGNIRELENILLQAIILSHGDVLERKNIILSLGNVSSPADSAARMVPLTEIEKEHIKKVLDSVGWNKMEASTILEITRPTLNAKIEKYGLKQA